MAAIKPTLSIAEVCERLGVSRSTVLRLISRDELHVFKVGRLTRIHVAELERFERQGIRDESGRWPQDAA